jgi:hypothetical protein
MRFAVTVQVTITKTYVVKANDEDDASHEAQDLFTTDAEKGVDETFEIKTTNIQQLE